MWLADMEFGGEGRLGIQAVGAAVEAFSSVGVAVRR